MSEELEDASYFFHENSEWTSSDMSVGKNPLKSCI